MVPASETASLESIVSRSPALLSWPLIVPAKLTPAPVRVTSPSITASHRYICLAPVVLTLLLKVTWLIVLPSGETTISAAKSARVCVPSPKVKLPVLDEAERTKIVSMSSVTPDLTVAILLLVPLRLK
jgi:hypothetical protein